MKRHLPSLLFGILLTSMAIGQLLSFGEFQEAIASYQVTNPALTTMLAVVIVGLELAGAAGIFSKKLPTKLRLHLIYCGLAVALVWSGLAVQALLRGLDIPNCGCFGAYLSQPLTLWVIPQDAYFVAIGVLALRRAQKHSKNNVG